MQPPTKCGVINGWHRVPPRGRGLARMRRFHLRLSAVKASPRDWTNRIKDPACTFTGTGRDARRDARIPRAESC
jgi:hypothetical protein